MALCVRGGALRSPCPHWHFRKVQQRNALAIPVMGKPPSSFRRGTEAMSSPKDHQQREVPEDEQVRVLEENVGSEGGSRLSMQDMEKTLSELSSEVPWADLLRSLVDVETGGAVRVEASTLEQEELSSSGRKSSSALQHAVGAASTDADADVVPRRTDFDKKGDAAEKLEAGKSEVGVASDVSAKATGTVELGSSVVKKFRNVKDIAWHLLVQQLCSIRRADAAAKLVRWLKEHRFPSSYDILESIVILGYGKDNRLDEAVQFAASLGDRVGHRGQSALIEAYALNGKYAEALTALRDMQHRGFVPDVISYTHVIQACRDGNVSLDIGLSLFDDMQRDGLEVDGKMCNDLIYACGQAKKPDNALYFLEKLLASGVTPDQDSYISLMFALCKHGRSLEAEALLEDMKWRGLTPRLKAYNLLLAGYAKKGRLQEIEKLKEFLKSKGVGMNNVTCGLLVDAYAHAGLVQRLENLFQEMREASIKPDTYMYVRMIVIYRDTGKWQKGVSLLRQMRKDGILPDRHVYNVIIDTYGKSKQLQLASGTFQKMKIEGIQPDVVSWNSLIAAYCRAGNALHGRLLYDKMVFSGCAPTARTFNILINGLGAKRHWDEVTSLIKDMRAKELFPNVVTYTTLVDVYARARKYDVAMRCIQSMKADGLGHAPSAYSALANAYAQHGMCAQALEVLKTMEKENIEISLPMLNLLTNAFGVAGKYQEAFAVFEYIKEAGMRPDKVTYTTLMKALVRAEKLDEVPSVFEEMIREGCAPDAMARDMLRSAYRFKEKASVSSGASRAVSVSPPQRQQ